MKTLLAFLVLSVSALAADPVLTDSQKYQVRDAQIKVMTLQEQLHQAQAAANQLPQIQDAAKKASDDLDALIKKYTPKGWVLQLDLKLIPEPKKK